MLLQTGHVIPVTSVTRIIERDRESILIFVCLSPLTSIHFSEDISPTIQDHDCRIVVFLFSMILSLPFLVSVVCTEVALEIDTFRKISHVIFPLLLEHSRYTLETGNALLYLF